jgi:hypothetical protein
MRFGATIGVLLVLVPLMVFLAPLYAFLVQQGWSSAQAIAFALVVLAAPGAALLLWQQWPNRSE